MNLVTGLGIGLLIVVLGACALTVAALFLRRLERPAEAGSLGLTTDLAKNLSKNE